MPDNRVGGSQFVIVKKSCYLMFLFQLFQRLYCQDNCPENATYKSNISAESILDAINVYFEAITLKEIQHVDFLSIYVHDLLL